MNAVGNGLGDKIGHYLDHRRTVIVISLAQTVLVSALLCASSDNETADIIRLAGFSRGDEIGKGEIGAPIAPGQLLAQGEERCELGRPRFARIEPDVIALAARRPETDDGLRIEPMFRD